MYLMLIVNFLSSCDYSRESPRRKVSTIFRSYTFLSANANSSSSRCGAFVPPLTATGTVSTLISSHNPASMKPCNVLAPPSTISDCTPCPCSQPAICPGTVSPLSKQRPSKHGCSRSITMRLGSLPAHRRTLSFGLSLSAVTRPTSIALYFRSSAYARASACME